MKYFKYKIVGLVLGMSLIITSCSDWLEMEPINQSYGVGFWTSEAAAQQTLAGGYSLLRTAILQRGNGQRYLHWGEMNAGLYYPKGYNNDVKFWDASFWNPNMDHFQWDLFYKVVAQANLMLEEVPELDVELFQDEGMTTEEAQASKDRYIGEALFLRAYTYFFMTRIWGGVPLVTEATTTVSQIISEDGYIKLVPRNTEEEVLNQAIADLKEAEGLLEYDTPGSNRWAVQANKGTVQTCLAEIYAWRGEYTEAEAAAAAAITNGNYELVDYTDSLDVIDMWEGRSTEGIFELNIDYDQAESYANGLLHVTAYAPYLYGRKENNSTWIVYKNSKSHGGGGPLVRDLYDANDIRPYRFFGYWSTDRPIILKYVTHTYEDQATYLNAHGTSNIMLMRYSGLKLLHAEALAQLGRDAEALAVLNEIRERAQADPFVGLAGDDLKEEIFLERNRELIGEGQIWYDRIRLKKFDDLGWMTSSRVADQGYYWPIALKFIIDNPLLTQNPFWAKKNW